MRVALLGPLSVTTDDGREVEIGGARLRTLMARLALDAPSLVTTTELIDALWEVPPGDAPNALQSLISRLRKALRAAGVDDAVVQSQQVGYRLAVAAQDVDVHRFATMAAEGRAELRAGRPAEAAMTLRSALTLCRGMPLAGIVDAPFAAPAVARLAESRLTAVEDRIAAELELGRHTDVLAELDELCAANPLREPLAALRLRALFGAGRQADALAGYAAIRQELADELGVDPSPELQRVHLALLRGEAEPARAPVALAAPPRPAAVLHGTSPARLTSFIGRDSELATALDLLVTSRLVCLVGPGGAGKTRLATELARGVVDREGVSVWFAELAPIGDGGDLAESLLGALGIREVRIMEGTVGAGGTGTRSPLSRLIDHFTGSPAVLVLDNCEHLIDAAAHLAETLLGSCPDLRVLATSREPLAVTGEALHWVGPLDLPDEHTSADQARQTSAVRLFVDRAMAARPGFTLDTSVLPAVAEICQRLDGMPLALELAAARLRSMSPQEVAERLDDRFALFTGGNRTAMPRHRTLRGVVEWSWDLLTDAEAQLARRLSMFAGGITVDSAVGICAGPGLLAVEVPYLLASLVEKSLLEAKTNEDGSSRYRMLETVRAYGQEKLAESGETEAAAAAFTGYFYKLVLDNEPILRTGEQLTAMTVLNAEHDNINVALRLAADRRDHDLVADVVLAMVWYWLMAGRPGEAITWDKVALDLHPERHSARYAALKLLSLMITFDQYPFGEQMVELVNGLLRTFDEAEDAQRYPVVLIMRPMLLMFLGRPDDAMTAARAMSTDEDRWTRAFSRLCVCFVAENNGDADSSAEALTEALDSLREIGERWALCFALSMDGTLRSLRADYEGAIRAYEEALAKAAELGSTDDALQQRSQLGRIRMLSGDLVGAERDFRVVLADNDQSNSVDRADIQFYARCCMVRLQCIVGDIAAAREHLAAARAYRTSVPMAQRGHRMAALMAAESTIDEIRGDLDAAATTLAEGLKHALLSKDMPLLATVGERVARTLMLTGNRAVEAAGVLGACAQLRGTLDQGDPDVRDTIDQLAEQLGEDGYAKAFRLGRELDRPGAIRALHAALGTTPDDQ
ncbi:MAG TPA: BTAD domain-containing putative transcriptional regulator [Pseudonocardiaceae bacterium]|nr:BTAD domain-containing putative transcriptional regulator [Pseudonocardiaceae bacterium]